MTTSFEIRRVHVPAPQSAHEYYASLRGPTENEATCLNHILQALNQANCMADSGPWPTQGFWKDDGYTESGVYGFLYEAVKEGLDTIFNGDAYVAGKVMDYITETGQYDDISSTVTTVLQNLIEENDPDF